MAVKTHRVKVVKIVGLFVVAVVVAVQFVLLKKVVHLFEVVVVAVDVLVLMFRLTISKCSLVQKMIQNSTHCKKWYAVAYFERRQQNSVA
jgi:hypothetical protein